MKTVELAKDLKVTLVKEGKVCTIDIDNPDWNWMSKYLDVGGRTTMQIDRKDLLNADEKFFRELIDNTYKQNKKFILEAKKDAFRAY